MSIRILTEACDHFYKEALFVHNLSRKADKMVIAYQSNVWLIDYNVLFENKAPSKKQQQALNEIIKMLGMAPTVKDMHGATYEDPYSLDGFKDTFEYITEKRPDVLIGDYDSKNKTLSINSFTSFEQSPISSVLIKKVVDMLGIKKIFTTSSDGSGEESTTRYWREDLLGRLPDVMYHGTSSKYAIEILKNGLMPEASPSNYPKVVHHEDKVFLTTKFVVAAQHAEHTTGRIKNTFKVVFGFQIPDKSKLAPDYDIDVSSSQTVWQGSNRDDYDFPNKEDPQTSMRLSRDFGMIGYVGRIPANFIRSIHIKDDEYYQKYTEVSKEDLICMIYEGVPLEVMEAMRIEQEDEKEE